MPKREHSNDCPRHPGSAVTARCVRFDRRFCEADFAEAEPVECLSAGTYCEYRKQCVLWERLRERRRPSK